MLTFDGRYWKVPAGETPWTLETTAKFGKGVENGILRSVGVVPKPLQKPHPDLFLPFASSENSIRWAAREGRDGHPAVDAADIRKQALRRLCRGIGQAARPRHRTVARRHHRRHRCGSDVVVGAIPASSPAMPGSSRSASAAACRTRRPAASCPRRRQSGEGYVLAGTVDTVTRGLEANLKRQTGRLDFLLHLQCADPARDAAQVDRALLHGSDASFCLIVPSLRPGGSGGTTRRRPPPLHQRGPIRPMAG